MIDLASKRQGGGREDGERREQRRRVAEEERVSGIQTNEKVPGIMQSRIPGKLGCFYCIIFGFIILPSGYGDSAKFPSAQAVSGRPWNIPNLKVNPTQASDQIRSKYRIPYLIFHPREKRGSRSASNHPDRWSHRSRKTSRISWDTSP